jgi:hypothetical protein
MRSWCPASGLLREILSVKGLETVVFRYGKIHIEYLEGEDPERIGSEILEIIGRHKDQKSW